MSGFWAAGPGWASWVVVACLVALGVLAGAWWGQGRGWKQCEEDMRWRRAQAAARRTSLIDYRPPETFRWHVLSECPDEESCPIHGQVPPEIAHEDRPVTWTGLGPDRTPMPRGAAHEAWLAHEEQALAIVSHDSSVSEWTAYLWPDPARAETALVRPDLTDSAYTQDMGERMDRFLAELCGVPYSADELWSGQ